MYKNFLLFLSLMSILFSTIYSVQALSDTFFNSGALVGTWYGKQSTAGLMGNATLGNLDASRTTFGLKGNMNQEIGVKWKKYLGGVDINNTLVYGGADMNGDARQDLFYVKGGKGYLVDLPSGLTIWETKVFGINNILGVESVFGPAKKKQIVVVFGDNPFYVGVIDGRTGDMITNSQVWGGLVKSWTYQLAGQNVIKEKQADNSVIYTISAWRSAVVGVKLYGVNKKVYAEPQYENVYKTSSGSTEYTSTHDSSAMLRNMSLGGKKYILTSHGTQAFIMDPSTRDPRSVGGDYSMNNYHTFTISPIRSHGYRNSVYDLDSDGNDEYIMWNTELPNYYQKTKLWVGGLSNGQIKNYWGISFPLGATFSGSKVLPIKNYADPSKPYIAFQKTGETKYRFYEAFGSGTAGYTTNVLLGSNTGAVEESFNAKLGFEYPLTYGDIYGIFTNGQGIDYIVTYYPSASKRYLFKFTGPSTFNSPPAIQINGVRYAFNDREVSEYGYKYFNSEIKGGDLNRNGKREFVVYESNYFKFYEIGDNTGTLVKSIEYVTSESTSPGTPKTRRYTLDGKDIVTHEYNAPDNTLKVLKSNTLGGQNSLIHLTASYPVYSQGLTSQMTVFSHYGKNYIHMGGTIYDASTANPSSFSGTKLSLTSNASLIDVDGTGSVEVISGAITYSLGENFSLTPRSYQPFINVTGTQKYGRVGDFDGDGVLDGIHVYKDSTDGKYKYYPVSSVSGNQIFPTVSTGNDSCGPVSFNSIRLSQADKDDLISIQQWCGHSSRIIKPNGNLNYSVNHMNTTQLFDIDGDGGKDFFGQYSDYYAYSLQATKITQSGTSIFFKTPIYPYTVGGQAGAIASVNRTNEGNLNFVVKGIRGEIISLNSAGQILFRSYYYDGNKYPSEDAIYADGGVPLDYADALVGDITGDGKNYIIAGGMDGWLYIIDINTGAIVYKYNIGVSITSMALGNVDNDGLLNVLLSAQDGYVYRIIASSTPPPAWVKDGGDYEQDIEVLAEDNKASVNFAPVPGAQGYSVQLYNITKKSPVFDWIDVGNTSTACVSSSGSTASGCLNSGRVFNLINRAIYEWRVQSYNNTVSSPIAKSDGFVVTTDNGFFFSEDEEMEVDEYIDPTKTSTGNKYYSEKHLRVFGDNLGIIVNSDNSPVESTSQIDIGMTPKEYKVIVDPKRILQGSGHILGQLNSRYSCKNILVNRLSRGDGVYIINAVGGDPFPVYCDMTTAGGGWTLVAISNTSKNTFGKNQNRASPFADYYTNEVDTLVSQTLDESLTGAVLSLERRANLLANSTQTLIKGVKGTDAYYVQSGSLNLGTRYVSNTERLSGMYYWDGKTSSYFKDDSWRTSLQTRGNNCGWMEYIPSLKINELLTAQRYGTNYDRCLGVAPSSPISIGWFIR